MEATSPVQGKSFALSGTTIRTGNFALDKRT